MLIESWIAALLFVLIAIISGIGLFGWIMADQQLEAITKQNKALLKENTKLKDKINFARLYVELEEKK